MPALHDDTSLPSAAVSREVTQAKQRFSIVGNAPALTEAIDRAIRVAPIDLSVLVTGPSGAGKEFFPKIIHQYGARKHKKYIAVNCGAIPEGTIDSELFGHEKGSFTGAISSRKGYFEEADGGTLFLDEVAELPLTTQARLLRVLESGEFLKVGSSVVQKTDVRIVAATNVDLLEAVKKGKFREDLYYRLSTVLIAVPPLSQRGSDIALLARKFASDFAEKYMTAPISFSEDARKALMLYSWPGNVRQLKNIIDQLALFHAGTEITLPVIEAALPGARSSTPAERQHTPSYEAEREVMWQLLLSLKNELSDLRRQMEEAGIATRPRPQRKLTSLIKYTGDDPEADSNDDDVAYARFTDLSDADSDSTATEAPSPAATTLHDSERQAIEAALARNDGNRRKTAEELNISARTLYRKIKDFGIENNA